MIRKKVSRFLLIPIALVTFSCGEDTEKSGSSSTDQNPEITASDSDVQSNQTYCESYQKALETIGTDFPQAIKKVKESQKLFPEDAPEEVTTYIQELIELGDEYPTVEEFTANKTSELTHLEPKFEAYMEDTCEADTASEKNAPEETPSNTKTTELVYEDQRLGIGQNSVTVDVLKVRSTDAEPQTLIAGSPERSDKNYLILDLQFSTTDAEPKEYYKADIKLSFPDSTVQFSPRDLFFTEDDSSAIRLQGNDSTTVVAAFKTDNLLGDLDGVTFTIDHEDFNLTTPIELG